MEEIKVLLQSPAFWVAAIISGLFFSIIGNLLSFPINKFFAKYSKKIAKKRKKVNNKILSDIDKNKDDPQAIISLKLSLLNYWIVMFYRSFLLIGGGIVLFILLSLFVNFIIYIICAVAYIIILSFEINNIMNRINHCAHVVNGLEKLKTKTH